MLIWLQLAKQIVEKHIVASSVSSFSLANCDLAWLLEQRSRHEDNAFDSPFQRLLSAGIDVAALHNLRL